MRSSRALCSAVIADKQVSTLASSANEINFPVLIIMAQQYLGVSATSDSADRLFSLAGRAFDDLRQSMKEEILEILMWARINKEKRQRA